MKRVASASGLEFGVDVVPLPHAASAAAVSNGSWCEQTLDSGGGGTPLPRSSYYENLPTVPQPLALLPAFASGKLAFPCAFFRDNATMSNLLTKQPNSTQNAVIFQSAYMQLDPIGITHNLTVGYEVYYNVTTSQFPFRGNDHGLQVMRAVDEALLQLRSGDEKASIGASIKPFPTPKPRLSGYDVVSQDGGVWFFLPAMIIFFSGFTEIVTEKELRLRTGLEMMGMRQSLYWLSWLLTGLCFSLLSTLVLMAAAEAMQFSMFVNTAPAVTFLVFFLFAAAMVNAGFFVSALIKRVKAAQTIGYGVILVGFVFQTIICSGYGALISLLFADNLAWWVVLIRTVLNLYPPFNFAKIYYSISDIAGKQYDYSAGTVKNGTAFTWDDLYVARSKSLLGFHVEVPAPKEALLLMLANGLMYLVLAWYLDNVLRET
eukprot:g6421.t1